MTKPLTMRFVVSVFAVVVTLAAATISASSSDPPSSSRTSSPVGNALDANAGKETAVERNKSGVDSKGEERGIRDTMSRLMDVLSAKLMTVGVVRPVRTKPLRAGTKTPTSRRNSFLDFFKTYMGMGGAAAKGGAGGKSVSGFKKWVSSLLRRFRPKKKSAEGAVGKVAADKTPDLPAIYHPPVEGGILKPPVKSKDGVGSVKKVVSWNPKLTERL